jgi:protein O-GlcNAc transferase
MAEQIIKEAGALINGGKLKEGLEKIENAIQVNPYHAPGWELKGRVLDALGRSSEARESYQRAKKLGMDALTFLASQKKIPKPTGNLNPNLIKPLGYIQGEESWTQHGASLVSLYKFEEALYCYDQALKFNPNYIPAKKNKTFLLRLTGWKKKRSFS